MELLDLPAEIVDLIIAHCIHAGDLAIMRTSRLLHSFATPLLHDHGIFRIRKMELDYHDYIPGLKPFEFPAQMAVMAQHIDIKLPLVTFLDFINLLFFIPVTAPGPKRQTFKMTIEIDFPRLIAFQAMDVLYFLKIPPNFESIAVELRPKWVSQQLCTRREESSMIQRGTKQLFEQIKADLGTALGHADWRMENKNGIQYLEFWTSSKAASSTS